MADSSKGDLPGEREAPPCQHWGFGEQRGCPCQGALGSRGGLWLLCEFPHGLHMSCVRADRKCFGQPFSMLGVIWDLCCRKRCLVRGVFSAPCAFLSCSNCAPLAPTSALSAVSHAERVGRRQFPLWLFQSYRCVRGRWAAGFGKGSGEVCSSPCGNSCAMLVPAGTGLMGTELPTALCCSAKLVEVGNFIQGVGDCVSVSLIS